MPLLRPLAPCLLLASAPLSAQDLCQGNGVGGAYIEIGPAYIGGPFAHDVGSPNVPGGFVFFAVSDGFQLTSTPFLGDVCLDTDSPGWVLFILPTDASGNASFSFDLPPDPALASSPNFYSHAVTFENDQWSVSKTTALYFQNADSWAPTQNLTVPRFQHTATALYADGRDNESRIFVAGGSSTGSVTVPDSLASTEVYHPLDRSFTPGPDMAAPRAVHTATRLQDGRVLIVGGMDEDGICHRTCELFDPDAGTITPAADLSVERASHTATLLLDGRVLVAGGLQDYQNPSASSGFDAAMNTAMDTAELYDPATDTWAAAGAAMASTRAGHTATLLDDGTVLVVGGAFGASGGSPDFTATVDRFDPATGLFVPEAPLTLAVGYQAASTLGNGDVLVTGGFLNSGGSATPTSLCYRWDGSAWASAGNLATGVGWHSQVALPNGDALIVGGLNASLLGANFVGRHDGTAYTALTDIGLNPGLPGAATDGRGTSTLTPGYDGTYVLLGGVALDSIFAPGADGSTGYVYTPAP
ncbi:MAG: kelch repeat-containing protein [Planctomycetota bacterium]